LLALHAFIMKISSTASEHPLEASRRLLKKGISVPYSLPLPSEETNWKVSFEPPSDITLVGSWPNKLSVKAKDGHPFGVDLAVEMPNVSVDKIMLQCLMRISEPFSRKRLLK
jgi:U3 small nucleolar RNA-associated protein 22